MREMQIINCSCIMHSLLTYHIHATLIRAGATAAESHKYAKFRVQRSARPYSILYRIPRLRYRNFGAFDLSAHSLLDSTRSPRGSSCVPLERTTGARSTCTVVSWPRSNTAITHATTAHSRPSP